MEAAEGAFSLVSYSGGVEAILGNAILPTGFRLCFDIGGWRGYARHDGPNDSSSELVWTGSGGKRQKAQL